MFSRSLSTIARRAYSHGAPKGSSTTPPSTTGGAINANVTGLSSNCVKPSTGKLGPGAATDADYKVPEYFSFNRFSYAEAEVEMAKYRNPQPSALKK